MNAIRFNNKTDFVAALESRRAFWRAYDARLIKEHKAAEKAWLDAARTKLREAMKLDYEALSKITDKYSGEIKIGAKPPTCPDLKEAQLDRALASLRLTHSKVFTVDSQVGGWSMAHSLLTWDPDAHETACS